MTEAIDTLKRSSGKQNFLYELPWYIIIGPPGAGKTTALVNSGLKFPLAGQEGAASIAGVGGTRYCDFWFTEDAVLIDTAGRYTTQDSDAETDRKSWLSFLSLLKQNRAKQPINGVILAISVEDLLTESPGGADRPRQRDPQAAVRAAPGAEDRLPGLCAVHQGRPRRRLPRVFRQLHRDAAAQGLGRDLPDARTARRTSSAQVPAEFDALVTRLTEELPDRLHEEPDAIARIAIFGFPAQFAALRDRVAEFLNRIFEPTRYQANANLRGFYFSSGTQEGTPIDQVLGAHGPQPGDARTRGRHLSGRGKSFFLHDLLKQRHLRRVGLGLAGPRTRCAAPRSCATAPWRAIAVVSLALLGAWGWSYASNKALIASADAAIERLSRRRHGRAQPQGDFRRRCDLGRRPRPHRLAISAQLRTMPAGYAHARRGDADRRDASASSQRGRLTRGIGGHLSQRAGAHAALAPDPAARAADHRPA